MTVLKFDYLGCMPFIEPFELEKMYGKVQEANALLNSKKGAGAEFTGWDGYDIRQNVYEYRLIKALGDRIRDDADAFVIIGIGGSYLGVKAGMDLLTHTYRNQLSPEKRKGPEIYFAGTDLSTDALQDLLEMLQFKRFYLNVISKSGTTFEPALAFRVLREELEKRFGEEGAAKKIIVTTDPKNGALRKMAIEKGYLTLTIPPDIGGRYSVLTPVGMFPFEVAGLDIEAIADGVKEASSTYSQAFPQDNPVMKYAVIRNILYSKGKVIEVLASFEPRFRFLGEWYKQLFGESEGKDKKGIFPASVVYTSDLHSMGQYMQDGMRNIFETFLYVENLNREILIPEEAGNVDGLNYLVGKTFAFTNEQAYKATKKAHVDGGVPAISITLPQMDEAHFGHLVYFFERACALSGYLLGVNPFNQPGVEAYKKEMLSLLKE
ncbi:MAG: glucose-6-phosphate isomerase [Ignavibacteriales bacterium]